MLLIKNGHVIDPKSNKDETLDILIKDNHIVRIDNFIIEAELPEDERNNLQVIYADNLFVAPGLVDVHSHFRDPGFTYKEDILTGAKAAAKGGYTTVVLMANTKPVVDNLETLKYVTDKASETDIHVLTCASITMGLQGKELTDMDTLKNAGAVGFTDDGIPLMNDDIVIEAMKKAASLNVPLSFHEENPELITNNGINHGKASEYYNIEGSPRAAEIDLIARDLNYAETYNAIIDIQHISTREGVELIRSKKAELQSKGMNNIHGEATPHHFSLTEEAVIENGTLAKMNPPLRTEKDRLAIIEGLKDNTIDIIATDHAPHSADEKAKPITEAPSGIIGLETALSLGISNLVKAGHLSYLQLIEKMTINPAKMYNLDCGYIAEGGPADLVIFNDKSYTVGKPVSKSTNSPFLGKQLDGEILYTICDGKIVYQK
ncbi:MAG: dihydroorotase [Lachnospiraceae bacterium]|nr:dihydroorotase [Lachnospiraceae bacterium]